MSIQLAPKYIIDGRSNIAYNRSHIEGSVSVAFPQFMTKRIIANPPKLWDLLSVDNPIIIKIRDILNEKTENIYYLIDNTFSDDLSKSMSSFYGDTFVFMLYDDFIDQYKDTINLVSIEFISQDPPILSPPYTPDTRFQISEIIPGLYLSGEEIASNKELLKQKQITTIINMTTHVPPKYEEDFTYFCFPLIDQGNNDIKQYFAETFKIIDKALSNNQNILVHCQAGISRSATIVIAYIIRKQKKTMDESLKFVQSKRSCVSPNLGFCGQLIRYEKELISLLEEHTL
jgi:protein-tyrosine phosphatase